MTSDPPYNTESKLSYDDSRDDWDEWIAERLRLTRRLMRRDGTLFVSIDLSR
jgi:adenine specific DNA methylase Mod